MFCTSGVSNFSDFSHVVGPKRADSDAVLNKCANEDCPALFLYLQQGKLFHFPRIHKIPARGAPMEAFWLCEPCSERMTLQWTDGAGVRTVPIPQHKTVPVRLPVPVNG